MDKQKIKLIIRIARWLVIIVPVVIFLWLLNNYFVPTGQWQAEYDFKNDSPFISRLYPGARLDGIEKNINRSYYYQRMFEEPVYFDVQTPRPFQKAELTIEYTNPEQPILELGVKKSAAGFNYDLKTLENKIIGASDWFRQENDAGIILLEKGSLKPEYQGYLPELLAEIDHQEAHQNNYQSVEEFLANLPIDRVIGTYQFDLTPYYRLPDYQKQDSSLVIENSLRGPHIFYTYLKDEPLTFSFTYQDINRKIGADPFIVKIYRGPQLIYEENLPDDGIIQPTGQGSAKKVMEFSLPGLSEGSYRLGLEVSDDIMVRKIETDQHLLVIEKEIFLADNREYSGNLPDITDQLAAVCTNGSYLTAKAIHPLGEQQLRVDDTLLGIEEAGNYYQMDLAAFGRENGLVKIESPKNDLLLQVDGYFSFSPESFFLPQGRIEKLASGFIPDEHDFIIAAKYQRPDSSGFWQEASQTFDLTSVYREDNSYQFIISAPGLADHEDIKINKIKVKLEKEPLTWKTVWPKFKRFFTQD